jgi:hypothetical protein
MNCVWSTLVQTLLALAALATCTLPAGGQAPQNPYPPPVAPQQNRPGASVAPLPAAAAPASPMDGPLALLNEAARSFQGVRDYSCLLVKQEQVKGQLQQENLILMKVRNQPFSVYLRWVSPKESVGQEVAYVAGRNQGQMRVHSPGILGKFGFVSIDPNDPRALATSRHQITEAGIGNLIGRLRRSWESERQWNRTQVQIAEYEYNKRRCSRVEMTHPLDNSAKLFTTYRTVVYFDKENHLPIRVEMYDWPSPRTSATGALQEMYSYADLRLNVNLTDGDFAY